MLSNTDISNTLSSYQVSPDALLCDRIRTYTSVLLRWNERVSLTTVTDPQDILRFHFGESFLASSAVPIRFGRLADVGSGAGFPGIPLAMMAPDLLATLIESNVKKSAFLSEVIRALALENVSVVRSRMENFPSNPPGFDFVTARAVGRFEALLKWSGSALAKSGNVVLWVGEDDSAMIVRNSEWSWREPIQIPRSRSRFLLVGSPIRAK